MNIFGSDHVTVVRRGNSGTINPDTKSRRGNAVNPGVNVSFLLRQHTSALLLVQKDNGVARKPLALRGCGGRARVGLSQACGVRHSFQLGIESAVEQHQKSESRGLDRGPMSGPAVGLRPGRIVQPISGVRKSLMKSLEIGVAGIVVAIEAEVS